MNTKTNFPEVNLAAEKMPRIKGISRVNASKNWRYLIKWQRSSKRKLNSNLLVIFSLVNTPEILF